MPRPHPPSPAPPPPCPRQLPLPLPPAAGPDPPALADAATLRPLQVWATLPEAARRQVRQALRRVFLEVLHDAADRR
jgi:hypothetical protein